MDPTGTTPELALAEGPTEEDRPRPPSSDEPFHAPFLWTVAALAIGILWIRPLTSSFWIDELGTWWVIQGSAGQAASRAEAVQGQSPLYYLIAWLTRQVTGRSELGLRIPSLVFCLIAAVITYRLTKRLTDKETARIAVVAFALWPSISFQASDARPYALAILATVSSAWVLVIWLDTARTWWLPVYVVLGASAPFVHPLFGLVLIPQAIYAVVRVRDGSSRVRLRELIVAAAAMAILLIPIVLEVLALWRRQEDWSVPNTVTVAWVVEMLVPPALVGTALIAAFVLLWRGAEVSRQPRSTSTAVLFVGWFAIPPACLVGLSLFSSVDLLPARYFLVAAPAGAILMALVLRRIEPPQIRRILIMTFAILSILDLASPWKSGDIRGAIALARSASDDRTLLMIRSGFQESLQPDWYSDPDKRGLLTAATSFYETPQRVVPLPVELNDATLSFVRDEVRSSISNEDRFIVITSADSAYGPWFAQYMRACGWTEHHVGDVNLFTVTEFTTQSGDKGCHD